MPNRPPQESLGLPSAPRVKSLHKSVASKNWKTGEWKGSAGREEADGADGSGGSGDGGSDGGGDGGSDGGSEEEEDDDEARAWRGEGGGEEEEGVVLGVKAKKGGTRNRMIR